MAFHCNIFSQRKVNMYASGWLAWFLLFSTTVYNISAISRLWVLLGEATEIPVESTDLPQVTDNLYHLMSWSLPSAGFELKYVSEHAWDNVSR